MENKETTFDKLNKIECKVEKKGRFNYVSWVQAWIGIKKLYPQATFKVYETETGYPAFIKPCIGGFVKIGVTIDDLEYVEHYPILDNYNKAIKPEFMNVFDINNAIKRGLAKAIALHGYGLYVFDGEDLPELKDKK